MVSALCCHVEVLDSIPGKGEIYVENSAPSMHPTHSAVMNRVNHAGIYLVENKAARGKLVIAIFNAVAL